MRDPTARPEARLHEILLPHDREAKKRSLRTELRRMNIAGFLDIRSRNGALPLPYALMANNSPTPSSRAVRTGKSCASAGPLQPSVERSPLTLSSGKFVTTLTLSTRTCRWPMGDPTEPGFHYCGHPPQSGRPYCDAHERKSYQPSRSRVDHRRFAFGRSH